MILLIAHNGDEPPKHQTKICSYTLRRCLIDRLFFFRLVVFWDVMLCPVVNSYRRFGGAQCFSSRRPRIIVILTLEKSVNWVTIRGTTCTRYFLISVTEDGYLGTTLIYQNCCCCFPGVTTHCGCIFHSPVAGFSLLVFEVS